VLAQAAAPGAGAIPQPDYILKECQETESTGDLLTFNTVNPAFMLKNYLEWHDKAGTLVVELAAVKTTLLQGTAHGEITTEVDNIGRSWYSYEPTPNYVGKDQAAFMAEYEGKRYKIVVNLVVSLQVNENPLVEGQTPVCPQPTLIKVNGKPVSGSSSYDLYTNSVAFADLPGAAVGQTTGSNITLDTNAAGYNWFIDTTPADNSEFLPTSNPNEWVAKAGSAAAGKMDMLSVLLHEYGHALGINHSADPNDFMGTTLTAGVRRLPTADELALMQNLIAQAKATLTNDPTLAQDPSWFDGLTTNGQDNAPAFPTLPLGTSFIGFLGLLRGSRYGGVSIAADASTLVTQYDWAANPTLTNGSLTSAAGWSTLGSVDIGPSTGSGRTGLGEATLNEVSGSQTRLSQAFLINPSDRFLSFTLAGTALDDLTGAP
jgi:hypothetical protein